MPVEASRQVVETWVGATGRTHLFTATQYDGSALDLTGKTVTIKCVQGDTVKVEDAGCSVTAAASGQFEWTQTSGLDAAGEVDAQVKVTDGVDPDWLEPFIFNVKATL